MHLMPNHNGPPETGEEETHIEVSGAEAAVVKSEEMEGKYMDETEVSEGQEIRSLVADNCRQAGFVTARTLLLNEKKESVLSPGFRSVAALAGWDDEALMASLDESSSSLRDLESLIVEDSPVRESRQRKKREVRTPALAKTPASSRRRNRRARTENIDPIDLARVGALSLEDDPVVEIKDNNPVAQAQPAQENVIQVETSLVATADNDQPIVHKEVHLEDPKPEPTSGRSKDGISEPAEPSPTRSEKGSPTRSEKRTPVKSDKGSPLKNEKCRSAKSEKRSSQPACMEQLQEELSCAVCLDICFEPSTTSCGHSFCKMCLENVIQKCGPRCPKCRQPLRGDFHACQINTVLWNMVQLLFPKEVEGRIKAKNERDAALKLEKMTERPNFYANQLNRGGVRTNGPNWQGYPTRGIGLRRPAHNNTTTANNFRRAFQSAAMSNQGRELPVPGLEENEPELIIVGSNEARGGRRNDNQEELDAALASRLQQEELMRSFRAGGGGGRRNRVQRDQPVAGPAASEQTRTVSSAAANLRAMASRAVRVRVRNQ